MGRKKKFVADLQPPAIVGSRSRAGLLWLILCILFSSGWVLFHSYTTDRHFSIICTRFDPAQGTPAFPSPVILREMALDGYVWNRHASHLGDDGRLRLRYTDFDNAPDGRQVHWSSGFAWYLRGLGLIRQAMVPKESLRTSVARMSIWANPILLALLIPILAGLTAWRFGWLAGSTIAFGTIAAPGFYEGFLPADPDHHGLIAAALLGTILGIVWAGAGWVKPGASSRDLLPSDMRTARQGMWISALFGAAGMWISALSQAMIMVGIGVGALLAAWVFACGLKKQEKANFHPELWSLWGRIGALATLGFYLLEYFPSAPALRLEVNHPFYAIAWWGGAKFIVVLGQWLSGRVQKEKPLAGRGRAGFIVVLGRWLAGWDQLENPLAWRKLILPAIAVSLIPLAVVIWGQAVHIGLEPFFMQLGTFIAELKPLLWRFQTKTLTFDTAFGYFPAITLAAIVLLFVRRIPRSARTLLLFLNAPVFVITALQFYQTRWGMLASPAYIVLASLLLPVLWDLLSGSQENRVLRTVGALALAVFFLSVPYRNFKSEVLVALSDPAKQTPNPTEALHLVMRDVAETIRRDAGNKPVVLLSSPNSSTLIAGMGDFRTIGTLYWENDLGLKTAASMLCAQSDDASLRLLKEKGITHIALISWENFIEPYFSILQGVKPNADKLENAYGYRALFQGVIPAWARPLPYPPNPITKQLGLRILLLAVTPDQSPIEAKFHLAEFLVAQNETVAAEIQLKEILAASPGSDKPRSVLARLLVTTGRADEGVKEMQRVFLTAPAEARAALALDLGGLLLQKRNPGAAASLVESAKVSPATSPQLANFHAWLLATASDPKVRNPSAALAILDSLDQAGAAGKIPYEDTKAAALAADGRYDEAISLAEHLLSKQIANGQQGNAAFTAKRLERYRARQPWIEE